MYLYKPKNCCYYIIYKQENGKYSRISTRSKLKSDANIFLSKYISEVEKRKKQKFYEIKLLDFIYQYFRYSESTHSNKTTDSLKWIFKDFVKFIGNVYLNEINQSQIEAYLNYKRKISVYTVQKHLAYLRSAFNYALNQNYILTNYFSNLKNYKIPEKLPKFFKPEEYDLFINSIKEVWFKYIVELAYNTGMRQMEIVKLNWEQIDFGNSNILLNNHSSITKSKKSRVIPFNERTRKILEALYKEKNCELVFNNNGELYKQDHITKKFKKHIRRININQSLNFHSLRHTFASRLVQKGVSIYHVSKLLGHASVTTTSIYAHLQTDDLRDSVKLLD
ncbi:MAG: site-specific integrase [Ignavibacteriae bacterium]|nr:site-specific integrase [Ignavibacteriota bacterium]